MRSEVGRYGVWLARPQWTPQLAGEVERLGYTTLWIGGSPPADLADAERLLEATRSVVVGTSIVNVWRSDAASVAEAFRRLDARHPGRFLLGVGVGHPESTAEYRSPYETLESYLDSLDAGGVPQNRRVVAALGPRVLRLAAARSLGAIPYLVTPEHTHRARQLVGPDVLLAPEHKVVLDDDPERARALGRRRVANPYLGLQNYVRNLRALGYTDEDVADGGSDALVDDLALHGTAASIAGGLARHLAAGADHVAVQPLAASDDQIAGHLAGLAEALSLSA